MNTDTVKTINREIYFRVWDGSMMLSHHEINFDWIQAGKFGTWAVMQFTGRDDADINGEAVWESDIIENCDTKALQVVYWNGSQAAWYCRYVEDENRIVSLADSLGNLNKKVGNIYENSDLLQK